MFKFTVFLPLFLVVLISNITATPSFEKIKPALQRTLKSKGNVNILVSTVQGATSVLNQITRTTFENRGEQATAVFKALSIHAAESQKSILQMLNAPRFSAIKVKSFWITNQVYIQGADKYLIESLAAMEDVSNIEEEKIVHVDHQFSIDSKESNPMAEWGINIIKAPEAWAAAGDGTGAVIGIIDTGARHTHEAIRNSYRNDTHSWYDVFTQSQNPRDGDGHGTHVTGTIAGSFGIGVAPGAKWISCKGIEDDGYGTTATFIECGQFMACPTTHDNKNPNCSLVPHAVSNSWGIDTGADYYDDVIRAWHAADIVPIFAYGNFGSQCETGFSPADSIAAVIAVGATTSMDDIASFSSRGPSYFGTQKPDISAPGLEVRSASYLSDTSYSIKSGTSMACPHVAGIVGLLKSINPRANYIAIKQVLQATANHDLIFDGQTCSGISDNQFPNYKYGYGRVNALTAVQAICLRFSLIENL